MSEAIPSRWNENYAMMHGLLHTVNGVLQCFGIVGGSVAMCGEILFSQVNGVGIVRPHSVYGLRGSHGTNHGEERENGKTG